MSVTISTHGKELTALIKGEIDHHTASSVREMIDSEAQKNSPNTINLDFSGVTFMDSSGIGLIMGRYRLSQMIGARLNVVNVPPHLQRMVSLSGITSLGVIKEDRC
ncbi:MAG: anti-sigma factor antagonist [Clostridia bacterium]|nr:anti-sigma factor antagonist [Clostridia bacterium]